MKLSYYMKIPVYNCTINDNINDESGIYAISFVDQPANETNFIALNKQFKSEYLSIDKKKQILTGVVLRPEQLIYRNDERGEYYIKFSSDEIEKISQKMMRTGLALYSTTHQHETPLDGNFLIELWTVTNPANDKSNALGFKDLPKGTLMCSYKIEDKNYWDSKVMTGDVKGFSLEGFFMQEIDMSKVQIKNNSSMKKKKFNFNAVKRGALLLAGLTRKELSDIESIEEEDTTQSGDPYVIFVLSDGTEVYVDTDGFATINEEQAPAGEHKLADGNLLVIDEQGQFVETREASTTVTDPEQATAAQTLSKKRKANLTKEKEKQTKAKQKLEEQTVNSDDVQSLKDRITELETLLADLQSVAEEAVTEVQELKKKTPSASPVVQKIEKLDRSKMSRTQIIAHALSSTIKQRNK